MADGGASFKTKTVNDVLNQHFKDDKTTFLTCYSDSTVKGTPLTLVTELLKVFTKVIIEFVVSSSEALTRAADQAKNEGNDSVTIEHFEKILPQMTTMTTRTLFIFVDCTCTVSVEERARAFGIV